MKNLALEQLRGRIAELRAEGQNFLRHSHFAMAQFDRDAERLQRQLDALEGAPRFLPPAFGETVFEVQAGVGGSSQGIPLERFSTYGEAEAAADKYRRLGLWACVCEERTTPPRL